ncbi:kicstor complex protein C12orf66 [Clonorchis sinensis]|uniref:Kicstor complex protein C12orf66 n=1 Tax=Clonorchis sinensis TaxID=79923 RepID=A0A8T1ML80_CLOSI|nr:kicstor complex protein C12orf66 [Clonorchis sinensis]
MAQPSVETVGSIFKSMLFIKQDELKERILSLPFEAKMFLNNTRISFLDGLQTFCRLEKAYYGLQFLASGFLFPRREYNRGSRTHAKSPALLFWLTSFYNVLLTKYTLYWFKVLSDCISNSDETLEVAGLENPSLVTRVINFQSRTNALYVSVLFDAACQDYPYLGHGFVLPGTAGDTPTGVKSFPPIFTAPLNSERKLLKKTAVKRLRLLQMASDFASERQVMEPAAYVLFDELYDVMDKFQSMFASRISIPVRLLGRVSAFERDCDLVEIISPTKRDALPCVLVDVKYLPDAQKHILSSEAARDRLVQFLGDLSLKPDQRHYTLIALAMVFMDGVDLNLYRSVVQITRPYVKHFSVL